MHLRVQEAKERKYNKPEDGSYRPGESTALRDKKLKDSKTAGKSTILAGLCRTEVGAEV